MTSTPPKFQHRESELIRVTKLNRLVALATAGGGGGELTDGDKGDITVSSTGTVWEIDAGAVTTAKLGGDVTAAGKALLDDADNTAQRATLGLGALATLATVGAAQIDDGAVSNAKLADVATSTIKGRVTAGTGDVEDLTATQVRTLINVANGATANSADATLLARANHTGTQAASTITGLATVATTGAYSDLSGLPTLFDGAWGSLTGIPAAISGTTASFTTAQETKLAGIATGATANTGTVTSVGGTGTVNGLTLTGTVTTSGNLTLGGTLSATASNISDFSEAVDDRVAALLVEGANITLTYNDGAGTLTIAASGGGGVSDGDKGDITVSASGATWTIDNSAISTAKIADDAVTYAKMQNIASGSLLGRYTGGSGNCEEIGLSSDFSITGGGGLLRITNTAVVKRTGSSAGTQVPRFTGATPEVENSAVTISDQGVIRSATNTGANAVSVPLVNWLMLTSDYTLTSTTAEQKAFNTTTNGRLTLPTGVYYFDCWLYLTTMSATSGNFAFDPIGAGTAVTDRWGYSAVGVDNTTPLNAVAQTGSATVTQQTVASAVLAATGTGAHVRLSGFFRISTGGTIIPSVSLVTANAAVVKAGSWFRVEKIGESSETTVGAWT